MENCTKLDNFLSAEEINILPEVLKNKINDKFITIQQLYSDLRNEKEEISVISERQQFQFEKEISVCQQQLKDSTETCSNLKEKVSELEKSLDSVQKQWRDLQKTHDTVMLDFQSTKRDNELLNQEKKHLSEQLEKRRSEIEKLNENVKSLVEQLTSANEAKYEAIATSEEAKMKESNLQHQINRLEQEKEMLNHQITDLNSELSEKNHEIYTLKREKSTCVLQLQLELENRMDEINLLQKQIVFFKETMDEKDTRIESLADKVRNSNEMHLKNEEQYKLETNAQRQLIELYKKSSDENQKRVQELVRAFEEAQKLLKDSTDAREEMEAHCRELENQFTLQLDIKESEIIKLKEELEKAKHAAKSLSEENMEKLFPIASATSKVLHSGMTLTEMYSEYIKLQEELQEQKNENERLTRELKQIVAEVEEKTPLITQRMEEYKKSRDVISCLKNQLADALTDYEHMLEERNDARRLKNMLERENNRFKSQIADLNQQVQALLKEVEEARGGFIQLERQQYEEEVTSSDSISASRVISRHLVTFKDIEEIQLKNQQLLAVVRDLSQQQEEMEKKISADKTAEHEKEIASALVQIEELQRSRVKQTELVETIIRQRDMYRVLLSSQGFPESFFGQSDLSKTFQGLKGSPNSSVAADGQMEDTKSAMNEIRAEYLNYKKEKAENEKILSNQLENLRNEVSDLKIQNAKLSSQCEYSNERIATLITNLETGKKECAAVREKNKKHTILITQHQTTINNLRQDFIVINEKLAKAEVAAENLKAERDLLRGVEARLLQEKESVIREQQHQSRVMANLQAVQNNLERIESETKRNLQYQVEKYEKENAVLKIKLENTEEEHRSALRVWEKQNKELQQKIDAEVDRNRKLHEDLVDAYSQVHALNQELISAKLHTTGSDKPAQQEADGEKTPTKQTPKPAVSDDVKILKEKHAEIQAKAKVLQEKLDIANKSSEQYLSMCKELEFRVKELDEINRHLKESMDSALLTNTKARSTLEKSLENMERNNRELLEENMKLSQSSDSQVEALQKKVNSLLSEIEGYKNQAEVATTLSEQARSDCQRQIQLMNETQEKYERELLLHAEDVKGLTELKEMHQNCSSELSKLFEAVKTAEQALNAYKQSWSEQEKILHSENKAMQERIINLEGCNKELHEQLELMGTQMATLQAKNWDETPYASIQSDLKDTRHLLQVIQFIKKENEIARAQCDVAQSENVRLNLKVESLTNKLKETASELKEIQENVQTKASIDAQHNELLKKIEMMNLLKESNSMLRIEKESLCEANSKLEAQIEKLEEKLQPLQTNHSEMSSQIETLAAENYALRSEVKSWQSRTNQLLEQSHRIGPQEYKNMVKEIEELKAQKTRLVEELQKKQNDATQMNGNITQLRKELETSRNELKKKTDEVTKMNEDTVEAQKRELQIKKIGRKYKTQYDELKVNYDALVLKSEIANAANQEQNVQDMQKKVEDSEKLVNELKEECGKQKVKVAQTRKAFELFKKQATEKEEKAKTLLAQIRQRYNQINTQNRSLTEENDKLVKSVDETKKKIAELQEEYLKNKSQSDSRIVLLERELQASKELRTNETDSLKKQLAELIEKVQKMSQQKQIAKPTVGVGERTSGSGSEPLTANIKPLTSPSTSGASQRHASHAVAMATRPPPTASIRPMAIGSSASSSQTRMAAVLPTTVGHVENEASTSASVPHAAVQPTPATATVAPTTMAVTVSPVISEVAPTAVPVIEVQEEVASESPVVVHIAGSPVVSAPFTALVTPRIDVPEAAVEPVTVDSPAPTTSVIVSPPTTQSQVTHTAKRTREESPGSSEVQEGVQKRVRMISEGSQTNQHLPSPSNVAVVSAAQVVTKTKSQAEPVAEAVAAASSSQPDTKEAPVITSTSQTPAAIPGTSTDDQNFIPGESETSEILEEQNIEWEAQDDTKVEVEFDAEVMEEEAVIDGEELDDDVEHMQGVDARSPDDEDMPEEQPEDIEEMADQAIPATSEIDILDSNSDIQMDADSSSLQTAPTDQCMAPPAFPLSSELPARVETSSAVEVVLASSSTSPVTRSQAISITGRQERPYSINRQHLTPVTIPGQVSSFEEGDDSIVPSTPTLYVPRRTDGFAEAVSSPHVPQVSFLFSNSESSVQPGVSQLATQGALGVDDTRMDLSQFDESGSRSVPSTPLQVSPPSDSAVPEAAESIVEKQEAASGDFPANIPTIKVDLVNTSEATGSEQAERTPESLPKQTESQSEAKSEVVADTSAEARPLETSTVSEDKGECSTSQGQTSEDPPKDAPKDVADQSAADSTSQSQSSQQRKPIVWGEGSPETSASSTATPEPTSSSNSSASNAPALLPTPPAPGRGRGRARRVKFPSNYARGQASWSGTGRRGRGNSRRRSMY